MPTPHIEAQNGDIARNVIMPGDPLRAQRIAETYLEGAKQINSIRNMLGFTGTWKGVPVTVMGSGMGIPSISIYAEELFRFYGVRRIIRAGTCGAMQKHLAMRDLIIAVSASTDSAVNAYRFRGAAYAPTADFRLAMEAYRIAEARGARPHAGMVLSADLFYTHEHDIPKELWIEYGTLCVEMEAAGLYTVAAKHNGEALTILTVSDSLVSGEQDDPEARERSYSVMMETSLDTIITNC